MDNLFEIAFFVIAMLVAFIHWLVKESGVFGKKKEEAERRQLQEEMQRRHARREQEGSGSPARQGQQQTDDWAALREAMGLPADTQQPAQQQPQRQYTEPQPQPTRMAKAKDGGGGGFLDVFEEETEGPAPKAAPVPVLQELFPPPTQAELAMIRAMREQKLPVGTDISDVLFQHLGGGNAIAESEAAKLADAAYDLPADLRGARRATRDADRLSGKDNTGDRLRFLLSSRDGIRQAILAREILGVPKAWQDDGNAAPGLRI